MLCPFTAGCRHLQEQQPECWVREDFGISAVEALACGAPVVARRAGGARDMVYDGVNGILFEGERAEGLAAAAARAGAAQFDYTALRASAQPFRTQRFVEQFQGALGELLK
jgi:glycosyltransferase involved in cell wall biosynthesis